MTSTLHRGFPAAELSVRNESRTICGVAVPFGVEATVSDNGFTTYREQFARGAFARTIRDRMTKVKLLRSHDAQVLAVGRASLLREDAGGLWAEMSVSRTAAGDELLELVRDGVVDSFSVGFRPVAETVDHNSGAVTRTEVRLEEISAVNFPAYADASIAGVRSAPALTGAAAQDLAARRLKLARARHLLLTNGHDHDHS